MTSYILKAYMLGFLLVITQIAKSQKDIIISDSLAANSERLNVKMGSQGFGKIWKFHFGEYGVVSSKVGWTVYSTKGNFFNTKTESKSADKFSFLMTNKANDSATVNAANNISVKSLQEVEILPHFSWGSNELVQESRNFSAFIVINRDTSETWVLFMNMVRNSSTEKFEAILANGERKILVIPTTSNKNGGDKRSQPALGYEFDENGQTLAALQYYGGGPFGVNKNIVWINKSLTEKIKLTLAAACTAILQINSNLTQPQF